MLCAGVGFATRQMGNMVKPNIVFSVSDGVINMKAQSTFKTTEISFKLNEEFDETTADDRKTKASVIRHILSGCAADHVETVLFSLDYFHV